MTVRKYQNRHPAGASLRAGTRRRPLSEKSSKPDVTANSSCCHPAWQCRLALAARLGRKAPLPRALLVRRSLWASAQPFLVGCFPAIRVPCERAESITIFAGFWRAATPFEKEKEGKKGRRKRTESRPVPTTDSLGTCRGQERRELPGSVQSHLLACHPFDLPTCAIALPPASQATKVSCKTSGRRRAIGKWRPPSWTGCQVGVSRLWAQGSK